MLQRLVCDDSYALDATFYKSFYADVIPKPRPFGIN